MTIRIGIAAVAAVAAAAATAQPQEPAPPKPSREFAFVYTAAVPDVPADARHVDLWIPVPRTTAAQRIDNIRFVAPADPDINDDPVHGNRIAHWRFDAATSGRIVVTMTFDCLRKELRGRLGETALPPEDLERYAVYLRPNRRVPVGETVRPQLEAAFRDGAGPYSRQAYDYVYAHMDYGKPEGKAWGHGDTLYACREGVGNCTDFHSLYISLLRSVNVPTKFEMGFSLDPDEPAGSVGGYHCWAQFYAGDGAWVPVDISEAKKLPPRARYYYGNLTPDRVQMTTGRDVDLVPKQAGEPLNYFIYPYAEADGRPLPVEKTFSFRDLKTK